ncbi:hydrogenase maturation nickel metallochaperone HypA [Halomonas faecis]|uniref:hydrogenase maturation nickel metallochaperone HypA n=1 Tax=Halomonas faecis TaxID=1562110 RepID=UPI0013D4A9FD|nr:hydrogenase maturation nickel metallochaperone HypA [Halomonas faecis]
MHEMSLCEGVIQVIEEQASQQGFERVLGVTLEIGALAGVELDALRFCFEVVCRDTLAEGAALHIRERAGRAHCFDCDRPVEVAQRFDACRACGGYRLQVTAGEELKIQELEVE